MGDELGRRVVHLSGATIPLAHVAGLPWWVVEVVLVVLLVSVVVLEGLRLGVGLDWWIYRRLTRPYEQTSVAGYALYAVGMATVGLLAQPTVAVPALLMLAVGDPVGGLLGGDEQRRIKRPLALGGTAFVCFFLAVPFLPLGVAAATAVTAALADGVFLEVRGHVIDDNLTIPLGAAVVATLGLMLT